MNHEFNLFGGHTGLLRRIAAHDKSPPAKQARKQAQRRDPTKIISISAAHIQTKMIEEYILNGDPQQLFEQTGLALGNLPPAVKSLIRRDPQWQEAVRHIFDYAVKKYQNPDRSMPNNRGDNHGIKSPDAWYRQASIAAKNIAEQEGYTMTGLRLPRK